jgi:hypothetical protein
MVQHKYASIAREGYIIGVYETTSGLIGGQTNSHDVVHSDPLCNGTGIHSLTPLGMGESPNNTILENHGPVLTVVDKLVPNLKTHRHRLETVVPIRDKLVKADTI